MPILNAAPTVDLSAITEVLSNSGLNVSNIALIVGASIAAGVPLMLVWFGARKAYRALSGAFQGKKVSV